MKTTLPLPAPQWVHAALSALAEGLFSQPPSFNAQSGCEQERHKPKEEKPRVIVREAAWPGMLELRTNHLGLDLSPNLDITESP